MKGKKENIQRKKESWNLPTVTQDHLSQKLPADLTQASLVTPRLVHSVDVRPIFI